MQSKTDLNAPKMTWEEFAAELERMQLSRAKFCELSGVAYATTAAWQQGRAAVPAWVRWALAGQRASAKLERLRSVMEQV